MKVVLRWVLRLCVLAVVLLAVAVAGRAIQSWMGPSLQVWHRFIPKELSRAELDQADWSAYLTREDQIMGEVRAHVGNVLPQTEQVALNRYYPGSPIYPPRSTQDWNRSYVIEPQGPIKGVAVFLHGLTDSPYSLRHFARLYAAHGFLAIGLRLPGHGTTPAALMDAEWEDWMAATRLVMREASRRAGPDLPLHMVGYSNGAALALLYALEAVDAPNLRKPDQIVLVSPMVGITPFASLVGLAALPAILPPFQEARWLNILPEFNPFKYNSFPVNAARQSYRLTQALQNSILRHERAGHLDGLPPILAFQSVLDHTVVARDLVDKLYAHLPANGSELVLFDVNRSAQLTLMLNGAARDALGSLLPPGPRTYRTRVITNASPATLDMVARVTEAGTTLSSDTPLHLAYPASVYSLSHIALPFPLDDGLYGLTPDPADDFGIQLGALASHGEYGALLIGIDMVMRMSSNPFLPYVKDLVAEKLPAGSGP